MVEGLQGLTAALKLESNREHNKNQECLDCLSLLGRWLQLSQSFVRMLDNQEHYIYA